MTSTKGMTKTVLKPNYEAAQNMAWQVLKEYADYQLPISLYKIIAKIPTLHTRPYSKLAWLFGCKVDEVDDIIGSENGGALWSRPPKGDFILAYDDISSNWQRMRFTVAHELGHFFLGHYDFNNNPGIIVDGKLELSDHESYVVYEQEANYFAKRLLVPTPVLMDVNSQMTVDSYSLSSIFQVSLECSNYIIKGVNNLLRYGNYYQQDLELSLRYRNAVNEAVRNYHAIDLLHNNAAK